MLIATRLRHHRPIHHSWLAALSAWRARLAPHRAPLFAIALALVAAQIVLLVGRTTFFDLFYDSGNYLAVTYHMAYEGRIFNALRTPVYPGFLALFVVLHVPHAIASAVLVQMFLVSAAAFEAYLLAFRLTHMRWVAGSIGVALAANPYVLQWERTVNSEALTFWLLITFFVVLERHLRRPSRATWLWLSDLLVVIVLTRPFFVYLPPLVLGILALRALRTGEWRRQWRGLALTGGIVALLLGGYSVANGHATGYYGLSDSSDINLFGEVLTCHMQDETQDPRFARLRGDVDAYIGTYPQYQNFVDPWPFLYTLHPEYRGAGEGTLAAYSRAIIKGHPAQFARCVLPTIGAGWLATPVFYAGPPQAPLATNVSALAQLTLLLAYLLLPLLVVLGCWWIIAPRTSPDRLILAIIALTNVAGVVLVGGLSYDPREFYRLRSPMDGLMVVAGGIVLWWGLAAAWRCLAPGALALRLWLARWLAPISASPLGVRLGSVAGRLVRWGTVLPLMGCCLALGGGIAPAPISVPLVPLAIAPVPLSQITMQVGMHTVPATPTDDVLITITFLAHDQPVALQPDEMLRCGGAILFMNNDLVDAYSVTVTPSVHLVCTLHLAAGGMAFSLTLPRPLTVQMPQPGATLARGVPLTLRYAPERGDTLGAIVDNGIATPAFTSAAQPETGTYALTPAAALAAGPGTLTLIRQGQQTLRGTPFARAICVATATTTLPVVWA